MRNAFIFSSCMGWGSVRMRTNNRKQGIAVEWQCPVAIIKKVRAVLTSNKRVPYAALPQIQVSPYLKVGDS